MCLFSIHLNFFEERKLCSVALVHYLLNILSAPALHIVKLVAREGEDLEAPMPKLFVYFH